MIYELSKDWQAFWRGENPALFIDQTNRIIEEKPSGIALLPGSFNPLHEAHRKLAETAARILKKSLVFELSISNVDKSTIDQDEALRRIEQFIGYNAIVITRAATFIEKAALFPGCAFVVGYDTAERILSPRYYSDEAEMKAVLKTISDGGGHFLVACRALNGELKCLGDLVLPPGLALLFSAIPADIFRLDISSTELREKNGS